MLANYYIVRDCNKQYMYIREKDINCLRKFMNRLHKENLCCVMSANDVNTSYDKFVEIFYQHFHELSNSSNLFR